MSRFPTEKLSSSLNSDNEEKHQNQEADYKSSSGTTTTPISEKLTTYSAPSTAPEISVAFLPSTNGGKPEPYVLMPLDMVISNLHKFQAESSANQKNLQPTSSFLVASDNARIGMGIITLSLTCRVDGCRQHFPEKKSLESHLLDKHGQFPFRCWAGCRDAFFPNRMAIGEHTALYHADIKKWTCYYCPQRLYTSYNTLYMHVRNHHEKGVFKCTWPEHSETFSTRQEVLTHIERTHHPYVLKTQLVTDSSPSLSGPKRSLPKEDDVTTPSQNGTIKIKCPIHYRVRNLCVSNKYKPLAATPQMDNPQPISTQGEHLIKKPYVFVRKNLMNSQLLSSQQSKEESPQTQQSPVPSVPLNSTSGKNSIPIIIRSSNNQIANKYF